MAAAARSVGRPLSVLCRPRHDVRPLVAEPRRVTLGKLAIMQRCGLITRRRRQVTGACDSIPGSGRVNARLGRLPTSHGALLAKVAAVVVHGLIGPVGEVAIARFLIGVRRGLVAIGSGLVAVGSRLIGVGERLILIGERLGRLGLPGGGRNPFLVALRRPVRGFQAAIRPPDPQYRTTSETRQSPERPIGQVTSEA